MLLNEAQPVKEDFQQQVWGAKKLLFVYISLNLLGLIVASYLLIKGVSFYFSVLCLMATCTLLFQLFMLYALASCSFTAVLVGEILLGVWMLVTAVMAVVMIGTVTFVTSNFILFYHNDNDDNIDNDSEEKHKESQRWSKMFGFLAVSIVVSTIGFGPFLIVQFLLIKRFDLLRKMLRQSVKDEENTTVDICLNGQTFTSSDEILENSCEEVK